MNDKNLCKKLTCVNKFQNFFLPLQPKHRSQYFNLSYTYNSFEKLKTILEVCLTSLLFHGHYIRKLLIVQEKFSTALPEKHQHGT